MSFAHRIKLIILGLLLFPAALFAQTSTTGRIDEGPLAARPTVCTPGDYYVTTDTNPVVEYKCSTGNVWNQEAGGGGGGTPGGVNGDTQCKNGAIFVACANVSSILYASPSGNDANSGKTWDTAKLTIMAAVCSLPGGGNCSASPKVAGVGTVYFQDGTSCNSNASAGCWIAGTGDSAYPTMATATGGPTAWTVETQAVAINLICAPMTVGISTSNRPTCQVFGPNHTVGNGNLPLVWVSGNSLGTFYINGMSDQDGVSYQSQWGRIGIDSATGIINGTPGLTQTVSFTIENSASDLTGGVANAGPALTIGNGFWMHFHDDTFGGNQGESCLISSISRTAGVTTVSTTSCNGGSGTTIPCPFLVGDHLSIRETTGDGTFNGTFTAASACSGGSTVTFNQPGTPNFSGPVGANGLISDDRAFGIVAFDSQVEMARMHLNGEGIKFYSGSSSNLQLNDTYMEGEGAYTQPILWISPLLYGSGGQVDVSGVWLSDTPTVLPSIVNDATLLSGQGGSPTFGGPIVSVRAYQNQGTAFRGSAILSNGQESRTTGLVASGQSGFYNNTQFESANDIGRRQAPIASRVFTNFALQNPASWVLTNATTTSGKRDPFGGTGAVEVDATAGGASAYVYSASQTVNVGDTWYFGAWARAVSGNFQTGGVPFTFFIGSGNLCIGGLSQVNAFTPFTGDGNWFWVTGSCQVWSTSGAATVALGIDISVANAAQIYRPFVFVVAAASGISGTEVADEINSLGFGPSTQAGAGDIVFPADKKLCLPSGSATNEFCAYFTHNNTANRSYTLPDQNGGTVALESGPGIITNQVLTAQNGSPAAFLSPGLPDGNGGAGVTTTPYTVQCDSGTTTLDRAHILRFQSGASIVNVPSSTAAGCTGAFVFTAIDEAAGTLTFNRTSTDTFSVYNGGASIPTGATTFTLSNGQSATLNQGATGIWEVRIVGAGTGAGAAPLTATFYLSPNCPAINTGGCINTFADTQEADDCSWTASAPDINCNTAHFVASDVGKSAMGGRTCSAFQNQTIYGAGIISASSLPSIASYVSATHITLSVNPANAQTLQTAYPQGGCFIWGHPDDAGASTLETAYDAATQCPKVELAAGYYMFTQIHFISQPAACVHEPAGIGDSTPAPNSTNFGNVFYNSGFELEGRGIGNTLIYLTPNFPNGTAWTNGPFSLAAFVIPVEGRWHDFQITGGYQGLTPANWPLNGELIYAAGANQIDNFACTNFGGLSTTTAGIGLIMDFQVQLYQFINSGCGSFAASTIAGHGQDTAIRSSFENSISGGVAVSASNGNVASFDFACYDCKFFNSQATVFAASPIDILNNGGRVFLEHTVLTTGTNTTGTQMIGYKTQTNAGGFLNIKDSYVSFGTSATNNIAIDQTVAGTVQAQNSVIIGGASGQDYADVAGSVFIDEGGNTFTPSMSISGAFVGVLNSANNKGITAPKLVLSASWGSTAAVTSLSGGNAPIQFTITNSGTGQAASPTITYTFPTSYPVTPFSCTATQIGGTNATGTFTSSSLTFQHVTFTFSLTPTASSTEIVQVTCVTP